MEPERNTGQPEDSPTIDVQEAALIRRIGGLGGGANVSMGDYFACIQQCQGLGNSEQILVCMEGCRFIDSKLAMA